MLIDLHAKSDRSKGVSVSARQVLSQARDAGLDAVAFCETLSTAGSNGLLDLAREEFPELTVFVGVEIPTDRGILLGFVPEIDSFYLAEEWRAITYMTTPAAEAVMQLFEKHNGVTIAARPYDLEIPFNMGDHVFTFDRLSAVEVFNPRVGALQNNFALEAATFMGLNTVGGSDPSDDVKSVGRYATFFDDEIRTQRQLVDALKSAEFWAVQIGDVEQKPSSRARRSSKGGGRRGGSGGGRGSKGGRRGGSGGGRGSRGPRGKRS
ncbi:hypothetical protein DL240_04950 [Lujinxingia litoralis]|uniref:Uncharacterized protein n=1 Tax=Lujinxingia litoralis TaxID=2211119 RepID=A0A328CCB0_9DELT|nr:PHP domain-containing protein [Lujinxingia litoralis]RAL23511.1 hypothetical protein DL240_04950 [Lujinxingia litoralis]